MGNEKVYYRTHPEKTIRRRTFKSPQTLKCKHSTSIYYRSFVRQYPIIKIYNRKVAAPLTRMFFKSPIRRYRQLSSINALLYVTLDCGIKSRVDKASKYYMLGNFVDPGRKKING